MFAFLNQQKIGDNQIPLNVLYTPFVSRVLYVKLEHLSDGMPHPFRRLIIFAVCFCIN